MASGAAKSPRGDKISRHYEINKLMVVSSDDYRDF
jgi:hypothetical protein